MVGAVAPAVIRRWFGATACLALAFWLSSGTGYAQGEVDYVLCYHSGVSAPDTIPSRPVGSGAWIDIAALARRLGGQVVEDESAGLEVVLSGRSLRFHDGTAAVVIGSETGNLLFPVLQEDGRCFAESGSLCRLIQRFTGIELRFEPESHSIHFKGPSPGAVDNGATNRRLAADRERWALDVVVIDPGHGGKDPGAIGSGGLKEKEICLDVGLRLAKVLREKGIRTILTRETDIFIPLAERTRIANRSGGKLFVSLHCNAAKNKKAGGMETYFLAPAKTARAMEVALLENEVIHLEDSPEDYRDITEENFILLSMAQATFTRESQSLAGLVQERVAPKAGLKNRGVDQAGFYVLVGASMPAILFEMAFITNPQEAKQLKTRSFRQTLAEGMGETIIHFLNNNQ
ncbi:MAG: N-acetylmuramoyl-L-alanine amidase [Calditrichaeota bacterium]|nr:N-acetylmuramoyl-L-alanine amidase [Calditrichota bacterium]